MKSVPESVVSMMQISLQARFQYGGLSVTHLRMLRS
jgi:hypothetical protein